MEPESNHIAYEINQPLEDFKNILNTSNFQSLIFFLKIKSQRFWKSQRVWTRTLTLVV